MDRVSQLTDRLMYQVKSTTVKKFGKNLSRWSPRPLTSLHCTMKQPMCSIVDWSPSLENVVKLGTFGHNYPFDFVSIGPSVPQSTNPTKQQPIVLVNHLSYLLKVYANYLIHRIGLPMADKVFVQYCLRDRWGILIRII